MEPIKEATYNNIYPNLPTAPTEEPGQPSPQLQFSNSEKPYNSPGEVAKGIIDAAKNVLEGSEKSYQPLCANARERSSSPSTTNYNFDFSQRSLFSVSHYPRYVPCHRTIIVQNGQAAKQEQSWRLLTGFVAGILTLFAAYKMGNRIGSYNDAQSLNVDLKSQQTQLIHCYPHYQGTQVLQTVVEKASKVMDRKLAKQRTSYLTTAAAVAGLATVVIGAAVASPALAIGGALVTFASAVWAIGNWGYNNSKAVARARDRECTELRQSIRQAEVLFNLSQSQAI